MLDEDNADEFLDPFWNYVKLKAAAAEKAAGILKKEANLPRFVRDHVD